MAESIVSLDQTPDNTKDQQKKPTGDPYDFVSESFDAVLCLKNPRVALPKLPYPNAKIFNNLDEYYKKTFKRSQSMTGKKLSLAAPEYSMPDRKFTAQQISECSLNKIKYNQSKKEFKEPKNVLTINSTGPQSLLSKCMGKRIRLMIRRRRGGPLLSQFSWISCLLVSYDKHFNLIVFDSDEVIQYKKGHSDNCCIQKLERHSSKLFIRGDNLVLISLI